MTVLSRKAVRGGNGGIKYREENLPLSIRYSTVETELNEVVEQIRLSLSELSVYFRETIKLNCIFIEKFFRKSSPLQPAVFHYQHFKLGIIS